ncbi:BQ2448_6661 [Microbotryum intermedium]|uniref:BQ2448_6661 protein n=1 Tax=Microbotryum intermedium TaxID=269621 RepID=A0A238FN59_9BASI|nr:BQ2448_6661 [Microbotryum intermedium]
MSHLSLNRSDPFLRLHHSSDGAPLSRVVFHPLRGDILIVASESHVEALLIQTSASPPRLSAQRLAIWQLNGHITAIDVAPWSNLDSLEVTVATLTPNLFRLRWSLFEGYSTTPMGEGMVSSTIHEIKYARAGGVQAARTVASVGDQGALLLWDVAAESPGLLKLIPHPFPLRTLCFHPTNASLIVTGDAKGMLRLINLDDGSTRMCLFEPRSLARSIRGDLVCLDWNTAAASAGVPTTRIGAVIDGRWALWDLSESSGGGPSAFGSAFSEHLAGRAVFRWSPHDPKIFAVLCSHPSASPALTLHNVSCPQAPRPVNIAPPPLQAMDMCWSPTEDIVAVVVDRDVLLYSATD